jgi:anion-transporting  ArsA/GET3 family ATPase
MHALDRYRLVVCVGTGGVGKTTIAAALALDAALHGRRALVLTIDPARALARALGLADLGAETRVPGEVLATAGIPPDAPLSAAMLDQKQAWDDFIHRHAPSAAVARELLANPFYQRLSTSFAGSTEYMAIEEMCRHAESGRYDLIVLDTPPAAHALDFVHAPERIDRLLDPGPRSEFEGLHSGPAFAHWLARPYEALGRGAWRSAGMAARLVLRRLEHATGKSTLRDISAFFVALDALVDATLARTRRARALLSGGDAAFVLVTAPRQLVLDETRELAGKLAALPTPLAAVVVNRVHELPAVDRAEAGAALAALGDDPPARWLRAAWDEALGEADDERAAVERFAAMVPPAIPIARVAEAEHDLHSLADLAHVVEALR